MDNVLQFEQNKIKELVKKYKLRVVVLMNPYDSLVDPEVQKLFSKIINFKIEGYLQEYPYGALPVDTYDFIANHVVLCQEKKGDLFPIMGLKFIEYNTCTMHKLQFPVFLALKNNNLHNHITAVSKICSNSANKK